MKRKLLVLMSVLVMMGTALTGCNNNNSEDDWLRQSAEKEDPDKTRTANVEATDDDSSKKKESKSGLEANAKYYNENMEEVSEEEYQNIGKRWVAYYFDEDGTPLVGECTYNDCLISQYGTILYDNDIVYTLNGNTFSKTINSNVDNADRIRNITEDEVREVYRLIKNAEGKVNGSPEIKELEEYFNELELKY